jgi:uncharacterized protein YutE (UPF0331/DUF86 family)
MREELHRRLLRHVEFLAEELNYYQKFRQLTWEDYRTDDDKRRSLERWVENIINSSVDISKLILSMEEIRQPDNYKEIVQSISLVKNLGMDRADELSAWVKFRNIVAHEYLDIRWSSIKRFAPETEALYAGFLDKVKKYLENKIAESEKK